MSSTQATANSFYLRRRNIGRAASPPTWACYEQIRYEDEEYSDSDSGVSCSEDDEDYVNAVSHHDESDSEEMGIDPNPSSDARSGTVGNGDNGNNHNAEDDDLEMEMEMGDDDASAREAQQQKDVKGKQKAVDPEPEPQHTRNRRHAKKRRQPTYTLRPILTIQRSQGFVWNQDLFVPPYIKDRYIASTSPPNSRGFLSTSASSTNSAMTDYEVEVVEIRIQEGEIHNIIP
ncbi:hypothetical protein EST38_g7081 [Candolleomyces aberdarensis]|uniref:Uncharacterized protein n=1 Tax=Candolleomyces aberdarensis TaxID=2316362 RepID=A0A4Q2DI60_9AGAR|nr:hypothetical protein EST38_g7081 [Candolleomyces aberdarensis]